MRMLYALKSRRVGICCRHGPEAPWPLLALLVHRPHSSQSRQSTIIHYGSHLPPKVQPVHQPVEQGVVVSPVGDEGRALHVHLGGTQ